MSRRLGARLSSAAEFVRQGAYFADIGTDHAYLPIFLIKEGKISRAVCADINKGPLDRARENAECEGVADRLIFRLTDGAAELSDIGITDYAICGMGGELIADIIERAPHLSSHGVRLILQPMTRQAHLRRYLASRGFGLIGEYYSFEGGKYYVTLSAEYDGEQRCISDFEAEFGRKTDAPSAAQLGYFETRLRALIKAQEGQKLDTGELISEAKEYIEAKKSK